LRLNSKLGEFWPATPGLKDVTLEQILSHTAGVLQVIPKGVVDMAVVGDLAGMLRHIESSDWKPLLPPGAKQQYHHFTFGWLLAGLLRGARQGMTPRLDVQLAMNKEVATTSFGGEEVADLTHAMNSSSIEEIAEMFEVVNGFLDNLRKGRAAGATQEQKVNSEVLMGVHGFTHWFLPSAFEQPCYAKGLLPGVVGYSTAKDIAGLLLKAEQGKILKSDTLKNMKRSRRCTGQDDAALPRELRSFADSEWGLGAELLALPGRDKADKGWGHTSSGGSFAVVVPGQRPLVVALLLNRTDSWKRGVPQAVLKAAADFAACGAVRA